MQSRNRMLALAAGIIAVFVAGVFFGKRLGGTAESSATKVLTESSSQSRANTSHGDGAISSTASSSSVEKKDSIQLTTEAVIAKIRETRALPEESRIRPLLHALEETSKLPFSKELLGELRSIISEGERESSHYIMSLMEQREDKASVAFLVEAAAHSSADVADRALFALEAVAGTVFPDRAAAAAWASKWQPAEDRAKLFAPNQAEANEDLTSDVPREISPIRKEPSTPLPEK
jgi:hypothetical protein